MPQGRLPSLSAACLGTNLEEKESLFAVLITSCTAPGKVVAEVGKEISWKQIQQLALIVTAGVCELLQQSSWEISRHVFQCTSFNAHICSHFKILEIPVHLEVSM